MVATPWRQWVLGGWLSMVVGLDGSNFSEAAAASLGGVMQWWGCYFGHSLVYGTAFGYGGSLGPVYLGSFLFPRLYFLFSLSASPPLFGSCLYSTYELQAIKVQSVSKEHIMVMYL